MSKRALWVVMLVALCLLWPLSRVVRQQVRLAQDCPVGQGHDTQGYCRALPITAPPPVNPQRFAAVPRNADGTCQAGYVPHPKTGSSYCVTPALYDVAIEQLGVVHLNAEQAAQFNARQQAKQDMTEAMQEAIRAENRREAIIQGN